MYYYTPMEHPHNVELSTKVGPTNIRLLADVKEMMQFVEVSKIFHDMITFEEDLLDQEPKHDGPIRMKRL